MRFDFNHYEAMTEAQILEVENLVNLKIAEGIDVKSISQYGRSKGYGSSNAFWDKYGDVVRVINVPEFSTELCGGVHIDNVGKIGLFKIVFEGGVSAGVRRIEAMTGYEAYQYAQEKFNLLNTTAKTLKTNSLIF